ncbi:MAG: L-lactate permease [Acidobacteriales bacterium]|nr:L-lactate permease [Terriglobales bacterium]
MWQHNYAPVAGSLGWSALLAAFPIFILLYLLGVRRTASWLAALAGLSGMAAVAILVYGMPVGPLVGAITFGAAFGLFPIGWIIFSAILLYRITVETGKFEVIKDSVGGLSPDRRIQALLIAFAFGAFIEGASGFGAPVAVAAAMLTGLGFSPFYAAGICLLANTAPVAFGSIGTPILVLGGITGLPVERLSAGVGRICAPISLCIPAYLILVMGGWKALRGVLPAVALCGAAFAGVQFAVSNYVGPQLTDLLSSLAAMLSLVVLLLVWKPKDHFRLEGNCTEDHQGRHIPRRELIAAWTPYALLVALVLLWGLPSVRPALETVTANIPWPGLHNVIVHMPPATARPEPYAAVFKFNWLAAPGTACLVACIIAAMVLRVSPVRFGKIALNTAKQLLLPELTIMLVLALAFLMNYCGAAVTLGLAFAATGALFPFFSSMLGWLGVFLTGSDTSANALFGKLQVVTAGRLGLNPILMAAANSGGGVMGKMISLQSIAVAVAATGMHSQEEGRLFRFTLRHSVLLGSLIGLVTVFYAYVAPVLAP